MLERDFEPADAQITGVDLIGRLGLTHDLVAAGTGACAVKCALRDAQGMDAAIGMGKGPQDVAQAGAVFEALEHYLADFRKIPAQLIAYPTAGDILSAHSVGLPPIIGSILSKQEDATLACLSYSSRDEAHCVQYPIGLAAPSFIEVLEGDEFPDCPDSFEYEALSRYSSNSGVAIGMNWQEAAIHGLLEAIERDATSTFLLNVFLLRSRDALRRVRLETLPTNLQRYARRIAEEHGVTAHVFELDNRFGIPTFCTWFDRTIEAMFVHGFGSSLSRAHALERSLSEAVQVLLSATVLSDSEKIRQYHEGMRIRTEHFPLHRRCANFDLGSLMDEVGCTDIGFEETARCDDAQNLDLYLNTLHDKIESAGSRAYSSTLFSDSHSEISVVHSLLSDQDYFHVARNGVIAMPCYLCRTNHEVRQHNAK